MGSPGGLGRAARTLRATAAVACLLVAAPVGGCAILPAELNLSPIWYHRCDENGDPLEWDLLWPIFHYERTPQGGDDFRIRPFWRRVTDPEPQVVEHQFLWPFGRVWSDQEETYHRLFPLWSWRSRINDDGVRDVDWYLVFPLIWGGASEDGHETYFAFLPFYADIPQFLTYDRFRAVLFPLYVALDKEGHHHVLWLWPLIAYSSCAENGHEMFRILPFYSHDIEPGIWERRYILWPFFGFNRENLWTDDPVSTLWCWPFFGLRWSRETDGWMFLWPFFEKTTKKDHFSELNLFWPFYHRLEDRVDQNLVQWWLWPLIGHVESDDQYAWSFLWPLIWWREYTDPDEDIQQEWFLPFFWHVHIDYHVGSSEDYVKVWPLAHRTVRRDENGNRTTGDWSVPSLLPWRDGNAYGFEELYGFLWQFAYGRQRAPDDESVDLAARLFTRRERAGRTQASVPFLFNYERSATGEKTLRLFQFIPIPFGGGDPAPEPAPAPEEQR